MFSIDSQMRLRESLVRLAFIDNCAGWDYVDHVFRVLVSIGQNLLPVASSTSLQSHGSDEPWKTVDGFKLRKITL